MSDPQPAPGRKKPRRAEPLQPDAPSRGTESGSSPGVDIDNAAPTSAEGEAGSKERPSAEESQTENAIKNTREGYK